MVLVSHGRLLWEWSSMVIFVMVMINHDFNISSCVQLWILVSNLFKQVTLNLYLVQCSCLKQPFFNTQMPMTKISKFRGVLLQYTLKYRIKKREIGDHEKMFWWVMGNPLLTPTLRTNRVNTDDILAVSYIFYYYSSTNNWYQKNHFNESFVIISQAVIIPGLLNHTAIVNNCSWLRIILWQSGIN